jgi:protein-disulfide isomerase
MFSDYNCGYCKKAHPALQALLRADNDIRIVIKEFPILGSMSQLAAMASLAVYQIDPEQHPIFQNQMFRSTLSTEADIVAIVESLGIAKEDFLAELPKSLYSQKLGGNLSLGEKLQINGTPAFVIDGEIYPGALSSAELLHIVNQARNASTS